MLDKELAAAVFVLGVRGLISCEETELHRPDGRDELRLLPQTPTGAVI